MAVKAIPDAKEQYNAASAGDLDVATQVPPNRHDARPRPVTDLRKALDSHDVDGPFVVHTTAAYPAPVAALPPLLDAGTEFDDDYTTGLIADAERAATPDDGVIPARLAESAMLRDMPAMPLWSAHDHLVWSERVRGVTAGAFTGLRLDHLTIKK